MGMASDELFSPISTQMTSSHHYSGSPVNSPSPDDWDTSNGDDGRNNSSRLGGIMPAPALASSGVSDEAGVGSNDDQDDRVNGRARSQDDDQRSVEEYYSERSVPHDDASIEPKDNHRRSVSPTRSRSLGTGTFSDARGEAGSGAGAGSLASSSLPDSEPEAGLAPCRDSGSDSDSDTDSNGSSDGGRNGSLSFLQFAPSSNASLAGNSRVSRATLGAAPRSKKGKGRGNGGGGRRKGKGLRRNLSFGSFGGAGRSPAHSSAAAGFFGRARATTDSEDEAEAEEAKGEAEADEYRALFSSSGNASWAGPGAWNTGASPLGHQPQQQQGDDENLIVCLPREGEFVVDTSAFSPKSELGSSPLSSFDEDDDAFGFATAAQGGSADADAAANEGAEEKEEALDSCLGPRPKSPRRAAGSPHRSDAAKAKSPHAMEVIAAAEASSAFKFATDAAVEQIGGCISHSVGGHSCMGPLHKVLFQRKGFEKFDDDRDIMDEGCHEQGRSKEEDRARGGRCHERVAQDEYGHDDIDGPLPSTRPSSDDNSRSSPIENRDRQDVVDPWGRRRNSKLTTTLSSSPRRASSSTDNGDNGEQRRRGRSRQSRRPSRGCGDDDIRMDSDDGNDRRRSRSNSLRRRAPSLSRALKKALPSTTTVSNLARKMKNPKPPGPPRDPKYNSNKGKCRHTKNGSASAVDMDSFRSPTAMLDDEDDSCRDFAILPRSNESGSKNKLRAAGKASKAAARRGNEWLLDRLARRGAAGVNAIAPRALT